MEGKEESEVNGVDKLDDDGQAGSEALSGSKISRNRGSGLLVATGVGMGGTGGACTF